MYSKGLALIGLIYICNQGNGTVLPLYIMKLLKTLTFSRTELLCTNIPLNAAKTCNVYSSLKAPVLAFFIPQDIRMWQNYLKMLQKCLCLSYNYLLHKIHTPLASLNINTVYCYSAYISSGIRSILLPTFVCFAFPT